MAKILLVDDDALMVKMYQTKFKADGFDIEAALDGEAGLKKVAEFKPDLILLDVMMPKMNGLEMLKKVKENKETKAIPVIMLTNVGGSEADVERALSLGAVTYLVKASYTPKEVVQKVKEVLGGYVREVPKVKVPVKGEEVKEKKAEPKDKKAALEEAEKAKKELAEAQKKAEEAAKKLEEAE